MDLSQYLSGAAATPPVAPASPSVGYPARGNPLDATPATKPGAYWYYQLQAEHAGLLAAAGLSPDPADLTQLLDSVIAVSGRPGHAYGAHDWAWLDRSRGLRVQWTTIVVPSSVGATWVYPLAFSTAVFFALATKVGAATAEHVHVNNVGLSSCDVDNYPGSIASTAFCVCVGV